MSEMSAVGITLTLLVTIFAPVIAVYYAIKAADKKAKERTASPNEAQD